MITEANARALSIRYDLGFAESLVHFVNAQLDPESNPDDRGATPEQEDDQQVTYKALCDCIDAWASRSARKFCWKQARESKTGE